MLQVKPWQWPGKHTINCVSLANNSFLGFFSSFWSSTLVNIKKKLKNQCSLQRSWQGINWNLWDAAVQTFAKQKVSGLTYAPILARFIFPPSVLLMSAQNVSSTHSRFCPYLAEMWCCIVRPWQCKITFSFHPNKQLATTFWAPDNLVQHEQGWSAGWVRPTSPTWWQTFQQRMVLVFPGFPQPWNHNRDWSAYWLHCLVIPLGSSHLLAEQRKPSEQSNGYPLLQWDAFWTWSSINL